MSEINWNVWVCGFWAALFLFQVVSIPALIMKKNDLADVLWGPAFSYGAGPVTPIILVKLRSGGAFGS